MLHERICVNGMSTRFWTLEQDLALYTELGVHSATIPYGKVAEAGPDAAAMIARSHVRPVLLGGGPATPLMGGLDAVGKAIDAARATGFPTFYSISGPAPGGAPTDHAYDALVAALGPICTYAASRNVRIAIENNSIATRGHGFVHTLADSISLADDTGVAICLELQNCWYERHLPAMFVQSADRLAMVQVSDFKVGEDLRLNRAVPGDGDMPLEWMLQELLNAGYQGLFDIEVLGPRIEDEGYQAAIWRSAEWLSDRFARWGV